jgi:uncharacterized Zn-binding protein involved in type VI secretion
MSKSVAINPPKTPCTTESRGMAKATIPNICKMPGPPAPFVPAPLPNIGKSASNPQGYSTTVKIEGNTVGIRGATFDSMGDMASKGTGGGLISANCHGPTKFITPGSMNVKIEGKNVHLLGEPMLNNCGPGGSPPNTGATMVGFDTWDLEGGDKPLEIKCKRAPKKKGAKKFTKCEIEEICAKCAEVNEMTLKRHSSEKKYEKAREAADKKCDQLKGFAKRGSEQHEDLGGFDHMATQKCADQLSKKAKKNKYKGFSPDHRREIQFRGSPAGLPNLKWMSSRPNSWIGDALTDFKTEGPDKNTGVAPDCCDEFK